MEAFKGYVATMDWQTIAALLVVGLTAAILIANKFRGRPAGSACGGGCGCTAKIAEMPRETVVYHTRKGERPEIIVKMK